jgi:hypothetical protein
MHRTARPLTGPKAVAATLAVVVALAPTSASAGRAEGPRAAVTGRVFIDRNANGRFDAGERGLPDVAVSNQQDVVLTSADGTFTLSSFGPTGVVFVTVPDGYQSRGDFFRRLDAAASAPLEFALAPRPATGPLTFVHASDTHIAEAVRPRMRRLVALIDSIKPSFVIVTGDLVRDALRVGETEARGYYELFQREASHIAAPLWTVPGNHEVFGIERDKSGVAATHPLFGRTMYRTYRGPDYYSFNAGGVHFVGLNSVDIDDTRYYGHVDSLQLAWLAHDLAVVPPTTPVVTFNHIPFFTALEAMHGLNEAPPAPSIININGKNQFRHTVSNAADVLAAIKGHPYPLALAGHMHVRERLHYEGTSTRFEQAAAIVGPTPAAGMMFTSGLTVYRITRGQIDSGRFVPLGIDVKSPDSR